MNPYETSSMDIVVDSDAIHRSIANRYLRGATVVLLIAGLYNYYYFDHEYISSAGYSLELKKLYRVCNLAGILALILFVWFLGLAFLEFLVSLLRSVTASQSRRKTWAPSLYNGMRRFLYCSPFGAVLWMIWVYSIYELKLDFSMMSIVIGVPAHLLAAIVYVPIIYGLYKSPVIDGDDFDRC